MSETVVVYVTRSGHSRGLAQEIGKRLSATVYEIGDLVNRRGLIGWLRSGRQAVRRMATPIRDPNVSFAGVKQVVLVQPIWASAVCPPLRSWLLARKAELSGVKLALLSSNGGSAPAALKARYDAEFRADLGDLAAFSVVRQGLAPEEKARLLDAFAAELCR